MIKKRQKRRKQGAINLTTRHLVGLVVLSISAYGAFRFWVGNPLQGVCAEDCESMYSMLTWVLAGGIILGAIVAGGAIIGTLIAFLRRRGTNEQNDIAARYSSHPTDAPTEKNESS